MDRVTRLYLSSYHGSGHIPQRRIGVLYLFGFPLPWLVLICRTCSHSHPCPTIVRARMAAGEPRTWMTSAVPRQRTRS
ncbi:hypothetical protein Afil01_42670 [Actinorhabdospora filicis]|uniref:Uncharacterized protein n=1 Tax=Actinorhabdospora filicis TaxID=1785913 RepID=A0A9W6WC70_9ACTN|nr:hypothetical protein Afil01_42670 [Actinorhabdospora filicis]